jgi:hypothetical protein
MTKLLEVQNHIIQKNYLQALRIVSKFPKIKGNADLLKTTYEILMYPQFYKQLYKDINAQIQKGINELISAYGIQPQ